MPSKLTIRRQQCRRIFIPQQVLQTYQLLPLLKELSNTSLGTCLAVPRQGVFFITAAAKSFPSPLVLSRLPTFHLCFYSSRLRCWISLTSGMKADLFFSLSTLIKRQQQEHQSILTRTGLQTGDRLQRTCKMSHDYADMRHIMCLRLLFSWNMQTFYHRVDFSGTATKMQGLTAFVFVTADTQHMAWSALETASSGPVTHCKSRHGHPSRAVTCCCWLLSWLNCRITILLTKNTGKKDCIK